MKLSIIIPTLNESEHIDPLVHSVNRIDQTEKEIIFVDGGSVDDTLLRIRQLQKTNPNIQLVPNPDKFVSQGFNRALKVARGKYVSLIGAHAAYPENYFGNCIKHIEGGECEVAGGFLKHEGKGIAGEAIAGCMGSIFGVGDTEFRTKPEKNYVDSVAFAVYDRRIFPKVGLFDEQLVRNQDDEFHYRLNRAGMRILLLPELETVYFVRNSLGALFRQYYQYGFYKPLVFKKVQNSIRLRHSIPGLFVLYLLSLPAAFFWPFWTGPFLLYLALDLVFSFNRKGRFAVKLTSMAVFPTLHLAYGIGFLAGMWHWRNA